MHGGGPGAEPRRQRSIASVDQTGCRIEKIIDRLVPGVGDEIAVIVFLQCEDRLLRERLDHRHVDPDVLRPGRNDDLQSRAEAGTRAADPASVIRAAGVTDHHSTTEQFDLELDRFQHAISER
jgi:hypothetical protein